jgi:hypothetical protein
VPPPQKKAINLRELDGEAQRAFELLDNLKNDNRRSARDRILYAAGARDPVTDRTLRAVADLFATLEIPLTTAGIARFKADRGLTGGIALSGASAVAYARALDGKEILFRLDKHEEVAMRPGESGALKFLRIYAKDQGIDAIRRLKRALDLGNPPLGPRAKALQNEYVGLNTVITLAEVSAKYGWALNPSGMTLLEHNYKAPSDPG